MKTPALKHVFALGVFAMLVGTAGVRPAHAEIIGAFTGSWPLNLPDTSFDGASFRDQSMAGLFGPIGAFDSRFSYDGLIGGYFQRGPTCGPNFFDACITVYSGTFSGGAVSFDAISVLPTGEAAQYNFTGNIIGGSFSGELVTDPSDILGANRAEFSFISTSTRYFTPATGEVLNGWASRGTLSMWNGFALAGGGAATLTMTTSVVPEPGGMALLGAGIGAVAALRRRRSRRISVGG